MEAVGIGPYIHFLSGQYRCEFFEKGSRDFTVHKHSLDGIAYARTLRFCVNDYSHRHFEIGFPVHICDAEPEVCLMTGIRANLTTASIKARPPRGTMRSMY